jgi:hypothetical protein
MVVREFQSYFSKRSDDFVNAVDVEDAAEEGDKMYRKNPPRRISHRYSVEAVQVAAAAWEESSGARKSAAAEDLTIMPLSGN